MKYMIIRKDEYEWLKKELDKALDINKSNINVTDRLTERINKLKDNDTILTMAITNTLDQLKNTEAARKKNASKIGGLTTSLNKERNKTKELLNTVNELEDTIELQKLESEKKDTQIKILKNAGKQKQLEDYKKLEELTKDINKHKKR